ncbi:S-adenosyl-L-methionine-dependent methyltransferase [Aspergillus unguis]
MSSQPKGRLISHFENRPTSSHGAAWSELWDSGDSGLWDRGIPSPALVDLLEEYEKTLLSPIKQSVLQAESGGESRSERKRALVPGCGRGYDVLALALHGFDAYGLEISATAVSEAEKLAKRDMGLDSSPDYYFGKGYQNNNNNNKSKTTTRGEVHFIQGDFFDNAWRTNELDLHEGSFDLVYEYTFLCALHPSQRLRWAERMAELLKPGGMLICLEFPMYKDPELPGPPWGVNGVHWEILGSGEEGGGKFTRRVYYKPERTFEVGKGTDWISVWERK